MNKWTEIRIFPASVFYIPLKKKKKHHCNGSRTVEVVYVGDCQFFLWTLFRVARMSQNYFKLLSNQKSFDKSLLVFWSIITLLLLLIYNCETDKQTYPSHCPICILTFTSQKLSFKFRISVVNMNKSALPSWFLYDRDLRQERVKGKLHTACAVH